MSFVAPNTPPPEDQARWPERLRTLSLAWRDAATEEARKRIASELWVLLNAALTRYIRLHTQSYGRLDPEDVRDIASEKSAAFLRNLSNGARDMREIDSSQLRSYISVLARNGLVDALRKTHRKSERELHEEEEGTPVAPESDGAEINLRHQEFLKAICACVSSLTPRAQTGWFLRAFLDMPSKLIASHPEVHMAPSAVDMMLSRTRKSLRECMETKGFNSDDAPPGTFVALWELLRNLESKPEEGESNAPTPDR